MAAWTHGSDPRGEKTSDPRGEKKHPIRAPGYQTQVQVNGLTKSGPMENSAPHEQRRGAESNAETPIEATSAHPTMVPDLKLEGKLASLPAGQAVRFCCHAPKAQSVFLVGTFNHWDPEATPMTKNANGQWSAEMELAPGRYRYEFVLDRRPSCEPGPDGTYQEVPDCLSSERGILNRMVEIA